MTNINELIERLEDLHLYMRDHYRSYPTASEELQTAEALKRAAQALRLLNDENKHLLGLLKGERDISKHRLDKLRGIEDENTLLNDVYEAAKEYTQDIGDRLAWRRLGKAIAAVQEKGDE